MPAKKKFQPGKSAPVFIPEKIAPLVHCLRHEKVILDADLAELYGVTTKVLNQAVHRNLDRYPSDFMFQLTEDEVKYLRSQIVTSSSPASNLKSQIAISSAADPNLKCQTGISSYHGGRRTLPYAFT